MMADSKNFQVRLETTEGLYSILLDGAPVIHHALLRVETEEETFDSSDARFSRIDNSTDEEFRLLFSDIKNVCDLELVGRPVETGFLVLRVVVTNRSDHRLRIKNLYPLIATKKNEGGFAFWKEIGPVCLLNDEWERCYGEAEVKSLESEHEFQSAWDVHLFDTGNGVNFSISFYEVPNAKISFHLRRYDDSREIDLTVKADTHSGKRGVILESGEAFTLSDLMFLQTAEPPLNALERYGQLVTKRNTLGLPFTIPTGWADWYFAYGSTTEEEVLRNLDFVARELKDFGVEYFEVDSAWQLGVETSPAPDNVISGGPWIPNSKFPHGMKWLADRIREKGLRPGIWVRPFQMIDGAAERKSHPEWFNEKGQMDFSNSKVWEWAGALFRMLVDDWGYEYVKYDFPSYDLFGEWGPRLFEEHAAREEPMNQSLTNIQAYREALRVISEASAGRAFLMACNSVMPPTLGLAQAFRIGDDVGDWERTLKYGVKSISSRYYANGIYWANDPDCLLVREPFTVGQAQMWASLIALSGGVVFISERVYSLPVERLEIIRKVLPVYRNPNEPYGFGRPVDLIEKTIPEIWRLEIAKSFGFWEIIGMFNWSHVGLRRKLDFHSVGLDKKTFYLIYDFWNEEFLGASKSSLDLELPPQSCRVLAIHRRLSRPQFLSSTRHITQGGIELEKLEWDAKSMKLSGQSRVIGNNPCVLSIHVPRRFRLKSTSGADVVGAINQPILRLRLHSSRTGIIHWNVGFEKISR